MSKEVSLCVDRKQGVVLNASSQARAAFGLQQASPHTQHLSLGAALSYFFNDGQAATSVTAGDASEGE